MTSYSAFALVSSLALLTISMAFLALWRGLKEAYWAQFAFVSLVAGVFYSLDIFTRPVGDRPNLFATCLALTCICTVMWAIARQQDLPSRFRQWLLVSHALVAATGVAMVAFGQFTRLQLFELYVLIHVNQAMVILLAGGVSWRTMPLVLSLSTFPGAVMYVALAQVDVMYLRYLVGLMTFLVCMCILVDGMLSAHIRLGKTVSQLDTAKDDLQRLLDTMLEGSTKVADAGQDVSRSAQELAMRTDQQTYNINSVAEVISGVADQVESTTANVIAVDDQCNQLRDRVRAGDEVVNEAVSSIQLISQRSSEMSEAIALIESVAFQTNILALNAAIEAARAGSAGRGFAVVATEVRALSRRTAESAQQVKQLIERTAGQVDDGVARIQSVKQRLGDMTADVEAVTGRTQQVASDARMQSQSLTEVKARLDELKQLTDANAQLVATSVMAADGMNDSATALRSMVEQGRAGGGEESAPSAASFNTAPAAGPQAGHAVEFF